MTDAQPPTVPQTHWVNGTVPAAVPPGMEHAILIFDGPRVFVDTLASMLTKSAYPPTVEPIRAGEAPATITATQAQMDLAARYEQNIAELVEWGERPATERASMSMSARSAMIESWHRHSAPSAEDTLT